MEKKEMSVESTVELQNSVEPKEQETGSERQKMELDNKAVVEEETSRKEEAPEETSKKEVAPEVFFQYREYETNLADVTERVKSHYIAKGNTEASIENMQIYIKPEDFTAYYVINDGIVGKVNLF